MAPVLGVLMLDHPRPTRADHERFDRLTDAMAASEVLGDGHHTRWIAVGLRDGGNSYEHVTAGGHLWSYRRADVGSMPRFLWDVIGTHPIEPNTGWMDSDAAAIRAARLEPEWRAQSDNRSANALMILHHPATTENPVWTFEMKPHAGDPILLVLDAVTGDRLEPHDVYVPGAPAIAHENVSTMDNNGFTLRHQFLLEGHGTDVLTVTLRPAEDPQPGTHVTAVLLDPDDVEHEFPDGWPEAIHARIDDPRPGSYTIEMRAETGGGAAGLPVAAPFGVEEIHITRCLLTLRPDPLQVVPSDACDP